jgi:hypothetical protein
MSNKQGYANRPIPVTKGNPILCDVLRLKVDFRPATFLQGWTCLSRARASYFHGRER